MAGSIAPTDTARVHLVTFRAAARSVAFWREPLREIAGSAPEQHAGLMSRHWRIDGKSLCGQYLFGDAASRDAFLTEPCTDAAYRHVTAWADTTFEVAAQDITAPETLDRPVIVIGAPRSGTTLLYDLLRASGVLWSLDGEREGVLEGVAALHPTARNFDSHRLTDVDAREDSRLAIIAGFVAGLRDHRGMRYVDQPPACQVRMLEKTPENCLRIPFLSAIFPSAKFVFVHRDARQAVSSICQTWRHPGFVKYPQLPGWDRGAWHLLLPEGWRRLTTASLDEIAAFQWDAANRQVLDDLDALPTDAWTSVEYAELITMPAMVTARLCEFAEIPLDEHLTTLLSRPLPLSATTISSPSALKWRSNRDFREASLAPYTATRARLRDLGRLSAPAPPPRGTPGPTRFACFLDAVPAAAFPNADRGSWIVAPSFRLQFGASIPVGLATRTRFRDRFLDGHPLLWITDPATEMTYAYWVSRDQAWSLRYLAAGQAPPVLAEDLTAKLSAVGALITPQRLSRLTDDGETAMAAAQQDFARCGYTVLKSVVPQAQVQSLGRYYRDLVAAGQWAQGDEQVSLRHGHHNETMARYFHYQLLPVVQRTTGVRVKPTYCYVSAYDEGAVLRAHVDRKQCQYTVSLWLDDGRNGPRQPWPLWFDAAQGVASVVQQPGDVVIFLGCDLPHWRRRPVGPVSTVLLFHYVPSEFVGTLQ